MQATQNAYDHCDEQAPRGIIAQPSPQEVAAALRSGNFRYWTPLRVAARAAAWLDELHIRSLVDVGSGAGKFCVATALMSRCNFLGIEHRRSLVATARKLAEVFGVESRVSFIEETFGDAPLPDAECYYFYNPFLEAMLEPDAWLDDHVEHSECRYDRELLAVEHWLSQAPVGTYALTYNGLGTELPRAYRELRTDQSFPCNLRLYRKTVDRR